MKLFITGASGFIGSHVAKEFLDAGHELVALVRNPKKLPSLYNTPKVTVVEGTLADHEIIFSAMKECQGCVHIALGWGGNPTTMASNDLMHTLFLLESALKLGHKHFLTTSSTAAMGELRLNMDEAFDNRPIDYYGATKAAAESFVLAAGRKGVMQCNIIRPGYAFGQEALPGGPSQPDQRFETIVEKALANEPIELIRNDGTQFIWGGDLAKIYREILDSDWNREIFLGLGSQFISWEAIALVAKALCNSSSEINLIDKGWSESPCHFNVSKINDLMGFDFTADEHIRNHLKYLIAKKS